MRVATLAFLALVLIVTSEACDIVFKIKSNTKNKFRIQIVVPAIDQKSEKIEFTHPGEKKIQIKGDNCNRLHWVVRTWKSDGKGGWVHAKETKAKFEGKGWIRVLIGDDLTPFFNDRYGILCSEGFCG